MPDEPNAADWFDRLMHNPHVEAGLLVDNQGRILRSSYSRRSDHEVIASMIQALEVMAQSLSGEMKVGDASRIQLMTEDSHLLLYPLLGSTYFLLVELRRDAPLMLMTAVIERITAGVTLSGMAAMQQHAASNTSDLDATELIQAVQTWLRRKR
ncbi:MAG: hypothetical protein CL610_18560 [Anaerolineaceae bacterium]|nr:hypothetical protein [Anaerolineaceae bacterium]